MTQSKHTQGPWVVNGQAIETDEKWSTLIAHAYDERDNGPAEPMASANARLIAAAPEMLEALRKTRAALGEASRGDIRYTPLLLEADAAIRKATGGEG